MDRMRRTDSSIATFASGDANRRPCRRSSDEIVCRLFFTRWWISRIVASFESSRRSRRRSSDTSRVSTTAPDDGAVVDQRDAADEHATRRRCPSISSVTGRADRRTPCAPARRRDPARRSAGPRRWRGRRSGAAPTRRWATCTPPAAAASRRITPSPTRGRLLGLGVLGVEREVAGRDHPGEPVEDRRRRCARARRAGGRTTAPTPG